MVHSKNPTVGELLKDTATKWHIRQHRVQYIPSHIQTKDFFRLKHLFSNGFNRKKISVSSMRYYFVTVREKSVQKIYIRYNRSKDEYFSIDRLFFYF